MGPGYKALRESAAYLDLSSRGKIFASGEDRLRLLHAMTTNQVKELQPGQGCYAFFLNPQGRILADANLFVLPDRILIDVEPETGGPLYQHLDKFIIADDVTLEDASESLTAIGVEGPNAAEVLAAMGAPIPDAPYSHVDWDGRIVARVSATGEPGFRIFRMEVDAHPGGPGIGASGPAGARQAALWRGHFRHHAPPGNTADARAELQQGLLYRAGDCGAHSLSRARESAAGWTPH